MDGTQIHRNIRYQHTGKYFKNPRSRSCKETFLSDVLLSILKNFRFCWRSESDDSSGSTSDSGSGSLPEFEVEAILDVKKEDVRNQLSEVQIF